MNSDSNNVYFILLHSVDISNFVSFHLKNIDNFYKQFMTIRTIKQLWC